MKGGGSRRWYGNFEHFVNWFDDGVELKNFKDEKLGGSGPITTMVPMGLEQGLLGLAFPAVTLLLEMFRSVSCSMPKARWGL